MEEGPRVTQFSMISASFQLCEAADRRLGREIACDLSNKQARRRHLHISRRNCKLSCVQITSVFTGEEAASIYEIGSLTLCCWENAANAVNRLFLST